jgi:hypothetical protein
MLLGCGAFPPVALQFFSCLGERPADALGEIRLRAGEGQVFLGEGVGFFEVLDGRPRRVLAFKRQRA